MKTDEGLGRRLTGLCSPTETTIGCTSRRVGPNDRKENIGRPFPSCSAYVVDRDLNIVPMGCPGELVIGGPLVARGGCFHEAYRPDLSRR